MAARILVVDDEPNIIGTIAPLLRARGYEVVSAMNGQTGLEAVERDNPDLLVLDLGLPDIDGVDVCRRVRAGSSLPILVLSARGAEGDKLCRNAEGGAWQDHGGGSGRPAAQHRPRREPGRHSGASHSRSARGRADWARR